MASVHITSPNHRGERVTKILQGETLVVIPGSISPWLLGVTAGSEHVTVKLSDSEVEEIVRRYNEEMEIRKRDLEYDSSLDLETIGSLEEE